MRACVSVRLCVRARDGDDVVMMWCVWCVFVCVCVRVCVLVCVCVCVCVCGAGRGQGQG